MRKASLKIVEYLFCLFYFVAFNLATKAITAGLNNQRILIAIDQINQKIDELTFSIAQLDVQFATKWRNVSVEVGVSTAGTCRRHVCNT